MIRREDVHRPPILFSRYRGYFLIIVRPMFWLWLRFLRLLEVSLVAAIAAVLVVAAVAS